MVGIAFDNFSGNTGDEAIGISVKGILNSLHCDYLELYAGSDTGRYETILIGGGHLLRELSINSEYNQFRIKGRHILNAMGIHGQPTDLDYLSEYKYVSVRSMGDRNKIQYISNVSIVPCTTLLLEDKPGTGFRVKSNSIGIHIYPETFTESEMDRFVQWCSQLIQQGFTLYFIPITLYRSDHTVFTPIVKRIGEGCFLVPNMGSREIFTVIGKFDCMISYSLHGAIFAYAHNVPFFLANVYEKNQFFMEDRGLMSGMFNTIYELMDRFEVSKKTDYSELLILDHKKLQEHIYILKSLI